MLQTHLAGGCPGTPCAANIARRSQRAPFTAQRRLQSLQHRRRPQILTRAQGVVADGASGAFPADEGRTMRMQCPECLGNYHINARIPANYASSKPPHLCTKASYAMLQRSKMELKVTTTSTSGWRPSGRTKWHQAASERQRRHTSSCRKISR